MNLLDTELEKENIIKKINEFEAKNPEIVFEWNDSETEAKGWLVINSLRGGAAGGGTRMREGLDKHEVLSLAKTMEIKFAIAGPDIGGGKSGINFNPKDPRKNEVLARWFKAVAPLLKNYYGTGGDLNVDEIKEVIPITNNLGINHIQEGVLQGHYKPSKDEKEIKIKQLQHGVSLIIENAEYAPINQGHTFTVSDMATGWGVAQSILAYYKYNNTDSSNKTAIIQGWGNVAAATAWFLSKNGIKIKGIIDRDGGILAKDGLDFNEINRLFTNRIGNSLNPNDIQLDFNTINKEIWEISADIFVPAAASRLVSKDQLIKLKNVGIELISSGANVPFADSEIFYGEIAQFADENFAVIPDFIANCGMARTFAYLMSDILEVSETNIFEDIKNIIRSTIHKIIEPQTQNFGLTQKAYQLVLDKIMP